MADKYVTVAGAGTKAGTSWADAFGLAEWVTDMQTLSAAGDGYWVQEGTYALSASTAVTRSGTSLGNIKCIGVKAATTNEPPVDSDFSSITDRPLITNTDLLSFTGNYWALKYLGITLNTSSNLTIKLTTLIGCRVENTGTGYAINADAASPVLYFNEVIAASNTGLNLTLFGGSPDIRYNYFHDSVTGIGIGSDTATIDFNIFDTLTTAVNLGSKTKIKLYCNTIYNCTDGLKGTTCAKNIILNNILDSCVNGINFTSTYDQDIIDYNNYYNNTTDVTGVSKGQNATAFDPQFTDAANGDFSLDPSSLLIGAGIGATLGVG